nr:PREDICTED: EF-hand calcium-binding domain-containing protein 1-like [Bemisia tabaci]
MSGLGAGGGAGGGGVGGGAPGLGAGGALMKSVSLFLSSGRRGSGSQRTGLDDPGASSLEAQLADPSRRPRNRRSCKMSDDPKAQAQGNGQLLPKVRRVATSNKNTAKMIDSFKKQTHFTRQEVEALCRLFKKLISSSNLNMLNGGSARGGKSIIAGSTGLAASNVGEGLDRAVFRELLHNTFDLVTEEVLMDRIFCAFDRCNDGVIHLDEWLLGLSVFLLGTIEERISYAFLVYDLNSDGIITREEVFHLLRNSLIKHPQDEDPDEGVRDLVELVLRKMDQDKDGKISFNDFKIAVLNEPLLLEAFGQCLPSEASCNAFLSILHY